MPTLWETCPRGPLHCGIPFQTLTDLRGRLTNQHHLANWDWSASRDSMAGAETCAHCLAMLTAFDNTL